MGTWTGPEKRSLARARNWNMFLRSSSPCPSHYTDCDKQNRLKSWHEHRGPPKAQHTNYTRFYLPGWVVTPAPKPAVDTGGRLHSKWIDQSRPLSQCACFCYEDLWAEVHTCSLEVWACHGSHSYKQYPDSLPTRTFTFPTRMVLKLRRPNFIRTVHTYISVRKNVIAWKTRLLPFAAFCGYFKRRQMKIR